MTDRGTFVLNIPCPLNGATFEMSWQYRGQKWTMVQDVKGLSLFVDEGPIRAGATISTTLGTIG